jgi:hypothetical protein
MNRNILTLLFASFHSISFSQQSNAYEVYAIDFARPPHWDHIGGVDLFPNAWQKGGIQ